MTIFIIKKNLTVLGARKWHCSNSIYILKQLVYMKNNVPENRLAVVVEVRDVPLMELMAEKKRVVE